MARRPVALGAGLVLVLGFGSLIDDFPVVGTPRVLHNFRASVHSGDVAGAIDSFEILAQRDVIEVGMSDEDALRLLGEPTRSRDRHCGLRYFNYNAAGRNPVHLAFKKKRDGVYRLRYWVINPGTTWHTCYEYPYNRHEPNWWCRECSTTNAQVESTCTLCGVSPLSQRSP